MCGDGAMTAKRDLKRAGGSCHAARARAKARARALRALRALRTHVIRKHALFTGWGSVQ